VGSKEGYPISTRRYGGKNMATKKQVSKAYCDTALKVAWNKASNVTEMLGMKTCVKRDGVRQFDTSIDIDVKLKNYHTIQVRSYPQVNDLMMSVKAVHDKQLNFITTTGAVSTTNTTSNYRRTNAILPNIIDVDYITTNFTDRIIKCLIVHDKTALEIRVNLVIIEPLKQLLNNLNNNISEAFMDDNADNCQNYFNTALKQINNLYELTDKVTEFEELIPQGNHMSVLEEEW